LGRFAGFSSLLGVYQNKMYCIQKGNDVFPSKLLKLSNSKIELGSEVQVIEKRSDGSFNIHVKDSILVFDAVIIASPIEITNLRIEGIEIQTNQREFQKIYIRIIKGKVNRNYFDLNSSEKIPYIILTTKDADPITGFSFQQTKDETCWTSMTSTKPLGNDLLEDIFIDENKFVKHTWNFAYPIFKPIEQIPPTFLDNNLFYINAAESVTSSLKTSAFSALNSVKKLKQQFS
jgi:hypothetical protein